MLPDVRPSLRSMRDQRPVVYGYLRAPQPEEIEIAAWKMKIARWCRAQDFHLGAVFVDRSIAEDQVRRPGVQGLLDALLLPGVVGVVVPNVGRLSAEVGALATLQKLIEDTNSELLCIEPESHGIEADGA